MRSYRSVVPVVIAGSFLISACGTEMSDRSSESRILVWDTVNKKWDSPAEVEFSKWVGQLGVARASGVCNTLAACLKNSSANSLYDSRDASLNVYSDCADLPMILRAYFAYKTKRPFAMALISGGRYTEGNAPTGAQLNQKSYSTVPNLFSAIVATVQSGFYRTAPQLEGTDTYPIDINKESLRPGTIFYDPNGHLLIVYRVEPNGIIRLLDSHPDNSLTVQTFGEKFARGGASQGGGFRNWRTAQEGPNGSLLRGTNSTQPFFSATAQYRASYDLGGTSGDYYKWVRYQMMKSGTRVNPIPEFRDKLGQLCIDLQDRGTSVSGALAAGFASKAHPAKLPYNIYGADGEWETYSTPSRDARLKAAFRELHTFVKESYRGVANRTGNYDYSGTALQLIKDYQSIWDASVNSASCQVSYRSSLGEVKTTTLNFIMDRLFDLSFDPYHCAELRWGVKPGDAGYAVEKCNAGEKLKWYQDENSLRNAIDRQYGVETPLGWGPKNPPDIHLPRLLKTLRDGAGEST